MINLVCYFEIPVSDLDRAVAFYRAVFGCDFERVAIDGNEMALFPSDAAASGASGALARGDSYVPGRQGVRGYFGGGVRSSFFWLSLPRNASRDCADGGRPQTDECGNLLQRVLVDARSGVNL